MSKILEFKPRDEEKNPVVNLIDDVFMAAAKKRDKLLEDMRKKANERVIRSNRLKNKKGGKSS